jgi:hypothetical protein
MIRGNNTKAFNRFHFLSGTDVLERHRARRRDQHAIDLEAT